MRKLLVCLVVLANVLTAQTTIKLKKRQLNASADLDAYRASPLKRRHSGSSHFLIQFPAPPSREQIKELKIRGFRVTSVVPDTALVVAGPDQASWDGLGLNSISRLDELDKLSPQLSRQHSNNYAIIEFHNDIPAQEMRAIVLEANLRLDERTALLPNQLLVDGPQQQIERLAEWDEVAYIFPASQSLIDNQWTVACKGAVTEEGPIAQYVKEGPGWTRTGPEGSPLELSYVLGQLTDKLPAAATKAEIERALNEWAHRGNISFTLGTDVSAPRTISIFFAAGDHGDPYPFDGPGKVLAHTFYPPPNSEPLAGDMHLDADESWGIGESVDVYSVVLHELGHALGLAHSDNPAAVMYPFYKPATGLNADDVAGIESLYGPVPVVTPEEPTMPLAPATPQVPVGPKAPTPPPPAAPTVSIATPALIFATAASALTISGTASGSGALRITWVNDRGGSGVASGSVSWITAVSLSTGCNHVTVTVTDDSNRTASETSEITLKVPDTSDTIAPTMLINGPATIYTSAAAITLNGTAADNIAVVAINWTNSFGDGGDGAGTTDWRIESIPLLVGTNKIAVKAYDDAGNSISRRIMVIRR